MNYRTKTILSTGLVCIFAMLLFPPWHKAGYRIIFDAPIQGNLDMQRIIVQVVLVVILCALMFLVLPSDIGADSEFAKTINPAQNDKLKKGMAACIALMCAIAGFVYWKKYADEVEAQRLAAEHQKYREQIRAEHELAAKEAARQQLLREEQGRLQEQQRQHQFAKKLSNYAAPRKLLIADPLYPGVVTYLHSFWKNEQLIYCLSMSGSAERLEYAADAHQAIRVRVLNRDGLKLFTLGFDSSELKPIRSRGGAVTGLATSRIAIDCDLQTYESISQVKI
jgi:hypothetical protein